VSKPYYTYSITHISPRPSPHSTSLGMFTLHISPCLTSLPFTPYNWSSLHFKFSSLHLSLCNPSSWKYSVSSVFWIHFTSLTTFLTLFQKVLGSEGKVHKAFIGSLLQNWMVLSDIHPLPPVSNFPVMIKLA